MILAFLSRLKFQGILREFKFVSLIAMVFAALYGCSTTDELVHGRTDPRELYGKAVAARVSEEYEDAEKLFKELMEQHPLDPLAVEALLMLGDVYYATEKYDDAASYYTNFTAMHPRHPMAGYAFFQKGMSHFKEILSLDRDQTSTKKALFAFEDLAAGYPASIYADKAREISVFLKLRLAEREFYIANFYYNGDNYKGALARLRDILKNYPDAGISDKTLYYIGESYDKLGEKRLAKEAYSTLVADYPESPFAGDARGRLRDI